VPDRTRRTQKPGFLEMVDPTLVATPPTGTGWVHEVKSDGYRLQAHLEVGRAQTFTRKGNDWTAKFPAIAAALIKLKAGTGILDGEIVAIGKNGAGDFHELRRQIGARRGGLPIRSSIFSGWMAMISGRYRSPSARRGSGSCWPVPVIPSRMSTGSMPTAAGCSRAPAGYNSKASSRSGSILRIAPAAPMPG
jgi:hypothetical protein